MARLIPPDNLVCPLDGEPLEREQGSYRCPDGHAFDIARQGYVNLLLVQQKKSRSPGDSREMVEARRDFLDAGHYAPIADRLAELVLGCLDGKERVSILDAGCGEGYYTDRVMQRVQSDWNGSAFSMIGVDISKPAITAATRRNRDTAWIVATNRNLPVEGNSVDIMLSLFGFPQYDHFFSLLKPGGLLLLADAGPRHLVELRERLYDEVRFSPAPSVDSALQAGFELVSSEEVAFEIPRLRQPDLVNLARMTPHYYRAPRPRREQLDHAQEMACSVEVLFRLLRKPLAG